MKNTLPALDPALVRAFLAERPRWCTDDLAQALRASDDNVLPLSLLVGKMRRIGFGHRPGRAHFLAWLKQLDKEMITLIGDIAVAEADVLLGRLRQLCASRNRLGRALQKAFDTPGDDDPSLPDGPLEAAAVSSLFVARDDLESLLWVIGGRTGPYVDEKREGGFFDDDVAKTAAAYQRSLLDVLEGFDTVAQAVLNELLQGIDHSESHDVAWMDEVVSSGIHTGLWWIEKGWSVLRRRE